MRIIVLVFLTVVSVHANAARGKITYLPKDGGPPIPLDAASAAGALVGRYSPLIGIATAAVQACIETQCINMLTGRAATPPPVPGWADPSTPPATGSSYTEYRFGDCNSGFPGCTAWSTSIEQEIQEAGAWYSYASGNSITCSSTGGVQFTCTSPYNGPYNLLTRTVCPPGYAISGGSCYLSEPSLVKWPSDGIPTFMLDENNNWIPHPNDPDTINPQTGQPFTPPPSVASMYSHDSYNNPSDVQVTANEVGGVTLKQMTEGVNSTTGVSEVSVHQITTDNQGTITNYTYQVFGNTTLAQAQAGQPSTSINFNPNINLNLPDDYAREPTLHAILDEMKKPPEPPGPIPEEEGPDSEEIPLPGITADGPKLGSGSCPADISISVLGSVITISMGPICLGAGYVAPLIIGFAWFLAAKIVGGGLPLE